MSKETVSALIKAVQESATLFISSGGTQRKRLVSNQSDSNYVQALESGYSSEITDIVNNIPDDPPPTPPEPSDYIDVLLGAKWTGGDDGWKLVDAGANDWWWGGVLSQEDRTILENFGLEFRDNSFYGPYGNIEWSFCFTFEPLAVYSDLGGQNLVTDDMATYGFYCTSSTKYSSAWPYSLIVWNVEPCTYRTWKCRITKKPSPISIEIFLGMKWNNGDWASRGGSPDWWWAGLLSLEDKANIVSLGLGVLEDYSHLGPYGNVEWSSSFTFEPLGIYSQPDEAHLITDDMDTYGFYCAKNSPSESYSQALVIWNTVTCPSYKYWKCRITKIS